jgi:tetratricopeptide (TPR) repeat protein
MQSMVRKMCAAGIGAAAAVSLFWWSCAPTEVTRDDLQAYRNGYDHYQQEQYQEAIAWFQLVINDYQYSSKVDNSKYYAGESYRKIGLAFETLAESSGTAPADSIAYVAEAINNFKAAPVMFDAIDRRSTKYVDALYWSAYSRQTHFRLYPDAFTAAEIIARYQYIIENFPTHTKAVWAQNRIEELSN